MRRPYRARGQVLTHGRADGRECARQRARQSRLGGDQEGHGGLILMTNEELMKKYGAKFDAMFDAKPGAILKRKKRKRSKAHNPVPDLLVDSGNLPGVAKAVRDLLAKSGSLFDRGVPVRLVPPANGGSPTAGPPPPPEAGRGEAQRCP